MENFIILSVETSDSSFRIILKLHLSSNATTLLYYGLFKFLLRNHVLYIILAWCMDLCNAILMSPGHCCYEEEAIQRHTFLANTNCINCYS